MSPKIIIIILFISLNAFGQKDVELYNKAKEYNAIGAYKNALKSIDKAIKKVPNNARYYDLKGSISLNMGDGGTAYNCYNTAILLEPNNSRYYQSRGYLFYLSGSQIRAREDYDKAIELAENDSLKYFYMNSRATTKMAVREFESAYEDLIQCYNYDSTSIPPLVNLGYICDEIGKPELTLFYLNKALELDSSFGAIYVNIGFYYQEHEDYEKSLAYFDKGIELMPYDSYSYNNRGYSKFKMGLIDEALNDINKAIELDPYNSYAFRNRALIYLAQGEKISACEDLNSAIELGFAVKYSDEVVLLRNEHCR